MAIEIDDQQGGRPTRPDWKSPSLWLSILAVPFLVTYDEIAKLLNK
jgi:hypothetical protein